MSEDSLFRDLIRRARAGDEQAEVELVRRYEPEIRRAVRSKLRGPALRSLLDSTDICQSVLASFFARIVAGEYELETPEQLGALLRKMASNKLDNEIVKQLTARRGAGRVRTGIPAGQEVIDPSPSPSKVLAAHESSEEIRKHLSEEEQQLAHLHNQGYSWEEIAARVGGEPNALRMRYRRAILRVRRELGSRE
jgi:RNA polymerase sigma-70 factor (ECF subfamily)